MSKKTILLAVTLFAQVAYGQKVDVYQRPVQVERSRDYDAIHYKISLNVDLDKKSLTGTNEITLVPLNNGFYRCILDAEYLVVNQVIDRAGSILKFEQKNNQVFIDLSGSYNHSDTLVVKVKYSLEKENLGLRFFDETPTNPKMASSDCFPNKAHHWIPCYDYPHDKVTMEMIVTVDEKYKVLSNGRLVSITDN